MAYFSPQLLLLVISSVSSLGQNEINRDLLWRSKKGITAQRLHRKREMLFLEIPRQRDRSRTAEEEVQAPGPVAPGGPARLLERVPPGPALQELPLRCQLQTGGTVSCAVHLSPSPCSIPRQLLSTGPIPY